MGWQCWEHGEDQSMAWLSMLRDQVAARGLPAVAKDLGVAKSTISMAVNGKYPARTDKIEARVLAVYGGATVVCPVLGAIDAAVCAANQDRARRIGLRAGNPETLRLFKTCSTCPVRGAKQGG